MAEIKFTGLPVAAPLVGPEILAVVQAGVSVQSTIDDIIDLVETNVTLQEAYDASPAGLIALAVGKPGGYSSTVAGFLAPSMTSAQFDSITLPDAGLMAWASNNDRFRVNKGIPGAPVYDEIAYVTDIGIDALYGEAYFQANDDETVIVTQSVPVKVNATYNSGDLLGFTQSLGTLTFTDAETRLMSINVSMIATLNLVSANISAVIFLNGSPLPKSLQSPFLGSTSPGDQSVSVSALVSLSTGDTIEIFVQNNDGTDNITVVDLNISVFGVGGASVEDNFTLQDAYDNGDGTIIQASAGKPFSMASTDRTIVPEISYDQQDIPIPGDFLCQEAYLGKNSAGTQIQYGRFQVQANTVTAGNESSDIRHIARSNGVSTLYMNYTGADDSVNFISDASFQSDCNFAVAPTVYNVGGVNFTIMTLLTPTVNYPAGSYQTMWQTVNGPTTIFGGNFVVGSTIELDVTGIVDVDIPGPNFDTGSHIKFEFVGVFDIVSDSIPLGNTSTRTRPWALKIKMTRVDAGNITVSAAGYYYDNGYANKAISMFFTPTLIPYDGLNHSFTLQYLNDNSPGSKFDFVAKNLNVKQYT